MPWLWHIKYFYYNTNISPVYITVSMYLNLLFKIKFKKWILTHSVSVEFITKENPLGECFLNMSNHKNLVKNPDSCVFWDDNYIRLLHRGRGASWWESFLQFQLFMKEVWKIMLKVKRKKEKEEVYDLCRSLLLSSSRTLGARDSLRLKARSYLNSCHLCILISHNCT